MTGLAALTLMSSIPVVHVDRAHHLHHRLQAARDPALVRDQRDETGQCAVVAYLTYYTPVTLPPFSVLSD